MITGKKKGRSKNRENYNEEEGVKMMKKKVK